MLVGQKNQLSLEYEIIPSVGQWVLGHFCMWAHGHRIGDFSDVLVLTAVQAQVERSLAFSERRSNPEFATASAAEATQILDEALYGEGGDLESATAESLKYGCHNLKEIGI